MERKLELFEIAGYFPHNLMWWNGKLWNGIDWGIISSYLADGFEYKWYPILRPISDLYKTITHNGKEIVPIVELSKIWEIEDAWYFGLNKIADIDNGSLEFENGAFMILKRGFEFTPTPNQIPLFDYLNELKIDYRGLIEAGLAIDCNTLEDNPYK